MNQKKLFGLGRHILTTLGGYLVGAGYLDESSMLEIVGGLMSLAGIFASYMAKEKKDA